MDGNMYEEKQAEFAAWTDRQIAACGKREKELLADGRPDESDFEKIKANIYDIFRTIFTAALKTNSGDTDAAKRFFLLRAEELPASWKASYDRAAQHGDARKMQTESIKLETAREVRTAFEQIWEVRNEA